jgi:hypothetical protein
MGFTVGRVSQIESGDISGIDVLDRYVTAIGGSSTSPATSTTAEDAQSPPIRRTPLRDSPATTSPTPWPDGDFGEVGFAQDG